jgi:tetratricopeptide (TPR) repeat protein
VPALAAVRQQCLAPDTLRLAWFDTRLSLCYQETGMSLDKLAQAWELLQEAYQAQMDAEYEQAVDLYRRSIAIHPTAEAHTYLGWTLHFQGKLEEAIEQCKKAIELDPDFGNPYNDIGAYLIELARYDEAIPWLERAIEAKRYDPRHYPHYNLGRVYVAKEMYTRAREYFERALRIEPQYAQAKEALDNLRRRLN